MGIQDLSDEELIIKAIELKKSPNDFWSVVKEYYEAIYNRYYQKAFLFCRYYGLRYDDSHDAVQEAFINLYNNMHTFKSNKKFKPWFFTIVFNCIKNKYNMLKKNKYSDLDTYRESEELKEINIFEKVQEKAHIRDIISKLPEKLKRVIILKIYSNLNSQEISEVLKITERQVFKIQNQAYEILAKLFVSEGDKYEK